MHTAICTFENRAEAERAVERLVQAGFDRSDVHLEYRHADGTSMDQPNDAWDGMEREVAVDRSVVKRFGDFFSRLFGHDDAADHAGAYSRAVERGHSVVVVDAHSDAEGERAQALLHGMEARDMNLVRREGQRPVRDIVGEGQPSDTEQRFGTARDDMGAMHNKSPERETSEFYRERAAASQGWGEQRTLDVAEPAPEPEADQRQTRGLGGDVDDKPR